MLRFAIEKSSRLNVRLCRLSQRQKSAIAKESPTLSAVQESVRRLQPGDKIHGYTVEKVEDVPELFLTTVSLEHDKTGAKHLHVARDDSNNTFGVAFKTTPMDSTGVPHILEHTVLCGSKQYPVRDPFFKMLNRSLSTFMNALTASDWTMYPFSTQNRKDYNNLLSVYLDAVFYPQLRELDFRQEGWRLEHENITDPTSPLQFKGVVYNEMKGVFSTQQNIFAEAVQNKLLPDHTYSVVSGGDPAHIPDLTWQQLRDFHKTHYHPSNARFFTYGNFPLAEHLAFINDTYLKHFNKAPVNTEVPLQARWKAPVEDRITCMSDAMAPDPSKQTMIAVNFLLNDVQDVQESTTMSIIAALLTSGESSPFYQALLEANIGSDYSPVLGYNGYTRDSSFSVGLQGIREEDVEKVKSIIHDTIDNVIRDGFEQSRIEAVLHSIELSIKHQTSNFGLGILMSIASSWNHDADASYMLKVNQQVETFKKCLADDPKYLQKKVKQYLKDNPHSLTLVMCPDEQFEERRQQKEEENLQKFVGQLSQTDRDRIFQLGQDLQQVQNSTEDLTCLPCIQLSEIDRSIKPEPTEHTVIDGIPVQFSAQPTNELLYLRMMSHLDQVPDEMKVYTPLFASIVTRMGAGLLDYKQLSHQAELYTGGLNATPVVSHDPSDLLGYEQGLLFSSHCLERNLGKMLELWTEIFNRLDLNSSDRLQTLIKMTAAELAAGLANAGHRYAMTHSASSLTPACHLEERLTGVTQASIMKKIAESDNHSFILKHLEEIARQVLNKNNFKVCVNATPVFMPTALKQVEEFIGSLRSDRKQEAKVPSPHTVHVERFTACPSQCQIELPFSVNYMSKSIQTVPYTHADYPALKVLSQLMTWKFLHREIREKGGAYGGGATCSRGVMGFYSYRDPNSMATIDVFDRSIEWATQGHFSPQDIEEAKLTVFKETDMPKAPGSIGTLLFVNNITDDMRQRSRDGLFAITKDDLVRVAKSYLVPGCRPASVSFLGPENQLVKGDKSWKVIKE